MAKAKTMTTQDRFGPRVQIRPPAGTKLPYVKCPNRCPVAKAGWAWTWYQDEKGQSAYNEHPVCNNCGTASIRVATETERPTEKKQAPPDDILAQIREEILG